VNVMQGLLFLDRSLTMYFIYNPENIELKDDLTSDFVECLRSIESRIFIETIDHIQLPILPGLQAKRNPNPKHSVISTSKIKLGLTNKQRSPSYTLPSRPQMPVQRAIN
jgi:hypothetical protein